MFIGREKELNKLESLYQKSSFEFLIMYGRRRIGKTELLKEFAKDKNVLFYSAVEKKSNLDDFASTTLRHFKENANMTFKRWEDIFRYIYDHAKSKEVIIIDEFPYIAKMEPSVKSILQNTIDHLWKEKNILLILCGSSVSFMVNEIMGEKSPLYGRNTAIMEILPFEFNVARKFLPSYSIEDQMIAYCVLGGVPYYLEKFVSSLSLKENIAYAIVDANAALKEEPIILLKAELREPATYNSILEAIARGANKMSEIADKASMKQTDIPMYLNALMEMRLIKRVTPCGEKATSRKSQYIISDNFFSFWYRFIFARTTKIDLMDPLDYVNSIEEELKDYAGRKFEGICYQYLRFLAKNKKLPFIPSSLGKWWGTDPTSKKPDDIDILGIDKNKYIFSECKFKNELFDVGEYNDLLHYCTYFKNVSEAYFYAFVKKGFTDGVKKEARKKNCTLLTIEDMMKDWN